MSSGLIFGCCSSSSFFTLISMSSGLITWSSVGGCGFFKTYFLILFPVDGGRVQLVPLPAAFLTTYFCAGFLASVPLLVLSVLAFGLFAILSFTVFVISSALFAAYSVSPLAGCSSAGLPADSSAFLASDSRSPEPPVAAAGLTASSGLAGAG